MVVYKIVCVLCFGSGFFTSCSHNSKVLTVRVLYNCDLIRFSTHRYSMVIFHAPVVYLIFFRARGRLLFVFIVVAYKGREVRPTKVNYVALLLPLAYRFLGMYVGCFSNHNSCTFGVRLGVSQKTLRGCFCLYLKDEVLVVLKVHIWLSIK